MKPIFISRKSNQGIGGLSRFYAELSSTFPTQHYHLAPSSLSTVFALPFLHPSHILLCDATLLPIGVMLKSVWKKPLIVSAHGLDLTYERRWYQYLLKWLLPKVDAIVLDSEPTKPLLEKFHLNKPTAVIPLGITTTHLAKSQLTSLPHSQQNIVLTTVGNLVKRKGHVWFISHVLTQLPKEYVYFIVGQGPEEKAIKKIIQTHRLSKRVFLLGQLSHAQLRYVFDETDIYICPNQPLKNNFESFGIAALEAAAMGLPVIASLVDGLSHTIRNEKNGIVVAPTAKDFLKAIYTLRRKTARKHLGEKAKTYTLKHFSWKTTANSYARLFAQLDKTQKSSQQSLAR